jgi:SRSO17 transposase
LAKSYTVGNRIGFLLKAIQFVKSLESGRQFQVPTKRVGKLLGTKGKLKARCPAVCVRIADGPPQRIKDKGQQHLPGEEAWLIGEHRTSGEKKYYLANLPAKTNLRTLAATIKARWICEQALQQLKEELGLDHFEGRSWQRLHRHALMTMIAYAFLQHRRLAQVGRKKNQRSTASAKPASRAPRHRRVHRSTATSALPVLQKTNRPKATA